MADKLSDPWFSWPKLLAAGLLFTGHFPEHHQITNNDKFWAVFVSRIFLHKFVFIKNTRLRHFSECRLIGLYFVFGEIPMASCAWWNTHGIFWLWYLVTLTEIVPYHTPSDNCNKARYKYMPYSRPLSLLPVVDRIRPQPDYFVKKISLLSGRYDFLVLEQIQYKMIFL